NNCTHILDCEGSEGRCYKTTGFNEGHKVTQKGCAHQFLCSRSTDSEVGEIIADYLGLVISCCEGNLCNNALRIGQSVFFLLLVPVASVILFN
ncbi:hypothetical protein ANANG_G00005080, partial [Anguilla anguilla]